MLVNGEKFACRSCVRGHRAAKCTHSGKHVLSHVGFPAIENGHRQIGRCNALVSGAAQSRNARTAAPCASLARFIPSVSVQSPLAAGNSVLRRKVRRPLTPALKDCVCSTVSPTARCRCFEGAPCTCASPRQEREVQIPQEVSSLDEMTDQSLKWLDLDPIDYTQILPANHEGSPSSNVLGPNDTGQLDDFQPFDSPGDFIDEGSITWGLPASVNEMLSEHSLGPNPALPPASNMFHEPDIVWPVHDWLLVAESYDPTTWMPDQGLGEEVEDARRINHQEKS
jgi:hypothetical protein